MRPDIVLLGETLSAGRPFGAVLVSESITDRLAALRLQDLSPVADNYTLGRVAGVISTLTDQGLIADRPPLMAYLRDRLQALRATCDGIASLHVSPVAIEVKLAPPFSATQIKRRLCERGVLVGLHQDQIVIAPALPMRPAEVDVITGALRGALANTPTWRPPVCCAACALITCE
jgi:acetylornithine/succinyldiaminopimelate/putrescine aminotransferase